MSHVQQPERRKRRADRQASGLYLPTWSVGAMILIVLAIVAALVMLLLTLGGGTAPSGEPRLVVITAEATPTPLSGVVTLTPNPTALQQSIPQASQPAEATSAIQPNSTAATVPEFALEGPTLAPIVFTPTPLSLAVGVTVRVDADELNVREAPGLDQTVLFQAALNERFVLVSGPESASDITWWQIEDPSDPTRAGWAAAEYLIAQP